MGKNEKWDWASFVLQFAHFFCILLANRCEQVEFSIFPDDGGDKDLDRLYFLIEPLGPVSAELPTLSSSRFRWFVGVTSSSRSNLGYVIPR